MGSTRLTVDTDEKGLVQLFILAHETGFKLDIAPLFVYSSTPQHPVLRTTHVHDRPIPVFPFIPICIVHRPLTPTGDMFVHTLLVLSLTILLALIRAEDTAQIACISYDAVPPDAIMVHPTFDGDDTAKAVLCTVS